jgi:hypothetical protein
MQTAIEQRWCRALGNYCPPGRSPGAAEAIEGQARSPAHAADCVQQLPAVMRKIFLEKIPCTKTFRRQTRIWHSSTAAAHWARYARWAPQAWFRDWPAA